MRLKSRWLVNHVARPLRGFTGESIIGTFAGTSIIWLIEKIKKHYLCWQHASAMNVKGKSIIKWDAYLQRLFYSGAINPSVDLLETLHRAQIFTIPFENFDILLGRDINLEPDALFDKMVYRKRGGYCFELNGLFLTALQAFGFKARALLARVHLTGTPSCRGHQLTLVSIEGREWITDVGFGSQNLRAPIPLELNHSAIQDGTVFRLVDAGPFGIMLQTLSDDQWQDLYSFDLGHVCEADITCANHFTSTHASSFFTYARVATLHTIDGENTLFNTTLKILSGFDEQLQELKEGPMYMDALRTYFGIKLDAPYESLLPMP